MKWMGLNNTHWEVRNDYRKLARNPERKIPGYRLLDNIKMGEV
jgi:hypothetical protein